MYSIYGEFPANTKRHHSLMAAMTVLSLLWVAVIVYVSVQMGCTVGVQGVSSCLRLDEWGEFIAGAIAPLAFCWLIVAVLLQSAELRAQRTELVLARQEFEQNRGVMSKQSEFIGEQTRLLLEAEKNEEFRTKLAVLRQWTLTSCRHRMWHTKKSSDEGYLTKDLPAGEIDFFVELVARLERAQADYATGGLNGNWDRLAAINSDTVRDLLDRIAHLVATAPSLGRAMKRVLQEVDVDRLLPKLRASLQDTAASAGPYTTDRRQSKQLGRLSSSA